MLFFVSKPLLAADELSIGCLLEDAVFGLTANVDGFTSATGFDDAGAGAGAALTAAEDGTARGAGSKVDTDEVECMRERSAKLIPLHSSIDSSVNIESSSDPMAYSDSSVGARLILEAAGICAAALDVEATGWGLGF